jgi:hypothetical protein
MGKVSKSRSLFAAGVMALAAPAAFGALYEENFNVDNTANWTINDPGVTDIEANFFYDYSAIGVPSASGGDTLGMKMTANNVDGVFGGFSVSPTGESFAGDYTVSFQMWQNYVGPIGVGGSGTTQLSMMGVGTAGNVAVVPGNPNNSLMFAATLDGGSSVDYRAYSSAAVAGYPDGDTVFAAAGTGNRNGSHAYYAGFGGDSAPGDQVTLFPGQTGSTDAGEIAFAWRDVVINVSGGIATWSIDGLLIATVDTSSIALDGSNILFGHHDTNGSSSADPNDSLLNVTLIDNIVVTPEPASLALLALGGVALLRRRR